MSNRPIFTIGHSNHPSDRFIDLLEQHGIKALVDIRRIPSSRRNPQFNRPSLEATLEENEICYHWLEPLGGHRKADHDHESPNYGLKEEAFRNYADYMLTPEFQHAANKLRDNAADKSTAIMCAEASHLQCHRRLVSDWLVANNVIVQHISPTGEIKSHRLPEEARLENGQLTYPGPKTLFDL